MVTELLASGVLFGLSVAAPVGPIGVLCIRRTLVHGRIAGLVSGLGAATADGFYGCLAATGFGLLLRTVDKDGAPPIWLTLLRVAGGLFLLYMAVSIWRSRASGEAAAEAPGSVGGGGLARMYLTTLGLTLTNPMTILTFVAMMSDFGVSGSVVDALVLVLGVFSGSALWWLLLSGGVSLIRGRLEGYIPWINRLSALIIFGFAVAVLID